MASADAKYTLTVGPIVLTKDGANEVPMFIMAETKWTGLTYGGVVQLQDQLHEALGKTIDMGYSMAETIGSAWDGELSNRGRGKKIKSGKP